MKTIASLMLFCFFVVGLMFILLEKYILYIFSTFVFSLLLSFLYRNKPFLILHWINPFILFHNLGYNIYSIIVGYKIDAVLEHKMLLMSLLSFYTFNAIVLLLYREVEIKSSKYNKLVYNIFCIVCFFALLGYLYVIFSLGFTTKKMIKDYLSTIPFMHYLYALTGLLITLNIFSIYKDGIDKFKFIIYLGLYSFIFLFLGERDLLFTFIIGAIFFYSFNKRRFAIVTYYSFLILVAFAAPYTQVLKSVLISEKKVELKAEFAQMGFNDFMTVGKNIERVYYINQLKKIEEKDLILDDIGNVLKVSKNSGRWYSDDFLGREQGLSGLGYSLQLTGYMDNGYLGIVILYFLVGLVTAFYSRFFSCSILGLSFFVSLITLLIYIQRQDLAFLLNFSIKFFLIPYFLLILRFKHTQ